MNLAIGILMFGLGIVALISWFGELVPFLKGVLVCSLLLWGAVAIVVSVAKLRAKRHLADAKTDEKSEAEVEAEARASE